MGICPTHIKMKDAITLTIDGTEVTTKKGTTVLEAAQMAGIYIPRLCYHPDLPPAPGTKADDQVYRGGELIKSIGPNPREFKSCQLCVVEIEGIEGFPTACNTFAIGGMVVHTNTPRVQELRRDNLVRILTEHPHACLLCEHRDGCTREPCTIGVPVNQRCCDKFGVCELQRVAEYIGIREDIPRYVFRDLPVEETTLFSRDHNLCIGCTRCVRACQDMQGVGALGFVYSGEEFILGTVGPSLKESGCQFCGACVEVCPTGALMDKGRRWPKREQLKISPVMLPPEKWLKFNSQNVSAVPETNGVYQLLDEEKMIILIAGTPNLRQALEEKLETVQKARYFGYEEEPMYTMRESELISKFLKEHGRLPELNDELADLF